MTIVKVSENDEDNVIYLPKTYQFKTSEIIVKKIGETVLLMPKDEKWVSFIESLKLFTEDFMSEESEWRNCMQRTC